MEETVRKSVSSSTSSSQTSKTKDSSLKKMLETSQQRLLLQQKKSSMIPTANRTETTVSTTEKTNCSKTNSESPKKKGRKVEKGRKNTFRAEGKNWLLTFPQCSMTKKEAMERLTSKSDLIVNFAVVGQEHHASGDLHLHMIVGLNDKLSTRRADYWDFVCSKHGDYRVIKYPKQAYAYVTKEDKEPTIFGTVPKNFLGSASSKSEDVAKMIMSGCTVANVIQEMPGFALVNLTKIIGFKSYITNVVNTPSTKTLDFPVIYQGTDSTTRRIIEWLNGNLNGTRLFKQKQLWISGVANMLKTTLLIKLSEYLRIYPLPLGEDFYDTYDDQMYDLITADEFKSQKTITFLNEFCQGGLAMNLRIKGGQIMKRKNLPMIICSNHTIEECYSKAKFVSVQALKSRFEEIELFDPIDLNNVEWKEKKDTPSVEASNETDNNGKGEAEDEAESPRVGEKRRYEGEEEERIPYNSEEDGAEIVVSDSDSE